VKDTYVDGEKLARNGRKTATYYAASFLPHYRRNLFLHLLVCGLITYYSTEADSKAAKKSALSKRTNNALDF
jgi:hypothetical protein